MEHSMPYLRMMAVMAIALAFGAGVAASAPGLGQPSQAAEQALLAAAAAHAACQSNFTTTYINDAISISHNFSVLSTQLTALSQDVTQLRTLAGQGNRTQFKSYLQGTFQPLLKQITQNFTSIRKNVTLSSANRTALKADRNSTTATLHACDLAAIRQYGAAKTTEWNATMVNAQAILANLTAKGVNGTGMSQVIAQGKSTIVLQLVSALNNATTPAQAQAAINNYCLFDGCNNGVNYHFDANFALQKLLAILAYVKVHGTNSTNQSRISQAQGYLNAASAALQQVGTSKYTQASQGQVWGNLTLAANTVRLVVKGK